MANSLLTLGTFSFEGLESPERIQLRAKQRLAVHHLGSGSSTIDYLGNDCETVSFRGIFSGTNAANRIRSLDYLRVLGVPQILSWSARTLSVIISQLELDYSSELWIPYRLSCYVVRSVNTGTDGSTDVISASPGTQVSDISDLLANTSVSPTSAQTDALLTLAMQDFDTPPPGALTQAQALVNSIDDQLTILGDASQNDVPVYQGMSIGDTSYMESLVINYGQQISLLLGRNRVISVITYAEDVNQQ